MFVLTTISELDDWVREIHICMANGWEEITQKQESIVFSTAVYGASQETGN